MTNPNYTHIQLIVDRSGSMSHIKDDMNLGMAEMLKNQSEAEGALTIGVTRFDTTVEHLLPPFSLVDDLNGVTLVEPRGLTAMNDGIGSSITLLGESLAKLPENDRPGTVIVVIVTDGMENASSDYTSDAVKSMIEKQQNEFSWEFVFLGANLDSFATGGGYGIPSTHSANFDYSGGGASYIASTVSNLITRSRSGDRGGFTEEEQARTK